MNGKIKVALAVVLLIVAGYAVDVLWAQTSAPTGFKSAIVGKVAISATEQTLTTYCGKSSAFLFKGYVAFDSANAGASNVIKATITSASDVTAAAGTVKEWSCVNSDSVIISGSASDYINIMGEEVKANQGVNYN